MKDKNFNEKFPKVYIKCNIPKLKKKVIKFIKIDLGDCNESII